MDVQDHSGIRQSLVIGPAGGPQIIGQLMSKHAYAVPDLALNGLYRTGSSSFMPRHRADHVTIDGIDYLTHDTVVQCIDGEGNDLDTAQIINMCGCGCGQYDVAPVGYEEDPAWAIANNSGLAVRVIDSGVSTAEGLPMVLFIGIFRMK